VYQTDEHEEQEGSAIYLGLVPIIRGDRNSDGQPTLTAASVANCANLMAASAAPPCLAFLCQGS
jgi:hypothetical protein